MIVKLDVSVNSFRLRCYIVLMNSHLFRRERLKNSVRRRTTSTTWLINSTTRTNSGSAASSMTLPAFVSSSTSGIPLRHCSLLPSQQSNCFCPRQPTLNRCPSRSLSSSTFLSRSSQSSTSSQGTSSRRHQTFLSAAPPPENRQGALWKDSPNGRARIAIVGKVVKFETKETIIDTEQVRKGIMGMRANAYWDSIGTLPLVFAGVGIVALVVKMFKVKGGQFRSGGTSSVDRTALPKSVITTEEEEAQLHVFQCGGCGYVMYPARGREDRFFPDGFKCPLCGSPRERFWDLNDASDPRNQVDEDEDDDDDDGQQPDGGDGGDDGDGSGGSSVESTEKQGDETMPAVSAPGAPVQMSTESSSPEDTSLRS